MMPVLNDEPEVQTVTAPRLDLPALYPVCFDLKNPRPLKIGIHKDLVAAGHDLRDVRCIVSAYCRRKIYLEGMVIGAIRIDLQGQPAGEVREGDAANALIKLAYVLSKLTIRPPKKPKPPKEPKPVLPIDAPLTAENIVSGRLELTVKFAYLPKPVVVKAGMKIGIQTQKALVVTTLKPKAWKKLEKAKAEWPQWVASMTGKLGAQVNSDGGAIVMLEDVVLQVFEKKVKPEAENQKL
jgi:hypothetical protein